MIRARGLVQTFHTGKGKKAKEVHAVSGVDLDVEEGEVVGFLGPNGAGKTTTLRMLTTLLRLQGRLYGLRDPDLARRIDELTGLVDIGDAIKAPIGTYSGGMKRRLDLAAALVHNPDVLFLDEPTTGLDPVSRFTLWEEVRRINARGTTVFLTTQYLEEADQLCDRLAIIDDGRIVREGTPDGLKADLSERRDGAETTLDDVFLDATGRTRDRAAGEVQEVTA